MSSTSSEELCSEGTYSDIEYICDPADGNFPELDKIVEFLYNNGIFSDIECRRIISRAHNVTKVRAAIYEIIYTKDSKTIKKILEVFRNRVHLFENPRYADLKKCCRVCRDWNQIVDLLFASAYNQINLEEVLLKNLLVKKEKIETTKSRYRKEEKKASIFQLMLAVNPEKDETILEILQIGKDVLPDFNESSIKACCIPENHIDNLIAKALTNNTVLSNIFQFLSLENIKNCRIVCRTWHSVSEPFLRRISTINFYSKFVPMDFINTFKYIPFPDLHFKFFKFRENFSIEERQEFFPKFGKYIQSLDLCSRTDIRSCLVHTPNLTELNFLGVANHFNSTHPDIMIPWSSLHSIKMLCLKDAIIDIDKDNNLKRISPKKIHFSKVSFFVGGVYPEEVTLNDYIDFTKATDVNVDGTSVQIQQFDWARDILDTERMTISNTRLVNAEKSESAVRYLKLHCQIAFTGKNDVSIKQLQLAEGCISLAALPPSLEKLAIMRQKTTKITSVEPIYLPNLNYLSYRKVGSFDLLKCFENCPNLTDMELLGMTSMDVGWLPRSIKRLKAESDSDQLNFVCRLTNDPFYLDILILDFTTIYSLNNLKFDKLLPKVLVILVRGVYKDEEFISFIRRNKKLKKIYVEFRSPPQSLLFSKTQLSKIVDKESSYFEFSNQRGKAITSEEYFTIQTSVNVKTVMKEFSNTDEIHNQFHQDVRENEYVAERESFDYDSDESYGGYEGFDEFM